MKSKNTIILVSLLVVVRFKLYRQIKSITVGIVRYFNVNSILDSFNKFLKDDDQI